MISGLPCVGNDYVLFGICLVHQLPHNNVGFRAGGIQDFIEDAIKAVYIETSPLRDPLTAAFCSKGARVSNLSNSCVAPAVTRLAGLEGNG